MESSDTLFSEEWLLSNVLSADFYDADQIHNDYDYGLWKGQDLSYATPTIDHPPYNILNDGEQFSIQKTYHMCAKATVKLGNEKFRSFWVKICHNEVSLYSRTQYSRVALRSTPSKVGKKYVVMILRYIRTENPPLREIGTSERVKLIT